MPLLRFICAGVGLLLFLVSPATALIMSGHGNDPVRDSNWPAGALAVANLKTRIGWWEGPPFGGGRYVFEYQGDNKALQEAIDLLQRCLDTLGSW